MIQCPNTVVSNHFHSVKSLLFSSARSHDFDGMLGTQLPVSMYTTKSPIDMQRFNVTQLKEFLAFSVKDRYQLNYFICIKDFNADNYFFKIKFVLFTAACQHRKRKTIYFCYQTDSGVLNTCVLLSRFLGISILQLLI